jgi:hypothetical protein
LSGWPLSAKDKAARLRSAAEFVEAIPLKQFNIEHWWLKDGMAFDDDRNRMYRVSDAPCGCAIGHMIQRGRFGMTEKTLEMKSEFNLLPSELREQVFVRIGDAFGVPFQLAEFMFDSYTYPAYVRNSIKPAHVAKRIRFVADEIEDSGV